MYLHGGIYLKSIKLVVSVLVVILGTAIIATAGDQDPTGGWTQAKLDSFVGHHFDLENKNMIVDKNVSFNFEQTVQGNGYYMAYKYAKMGNSEFKDYAHGSGSLDNQAILTSYDSSHQYHLWNADWNDYNVNCIQYKETTHAVYAPTRIAVGTGYYAVNPLNYDSLIKEETWVKNRLSGSSMENQVEYAHKLDKDLTAFTKEYTDFTYDPLFKSNAITQMKINEDVGEGKIHIGVLQASKDNTGSIPTTMIDTAPVGIGGKIGTAWHKPAVEIDEDYWGTYHVEKNMTLAVPYTKNAPSYDWLPCSCNAGWDDMTIHDQRYHSAKGFFDCTTCWPGAPCGAENYPVAGAPATPSPYLGYPNPPH